MAIASARDLIQRHTRGVLNRTSVPTGLVDTAGAKAAKDLADIKAAEDAKKAAPTTPATPAPGQGGQPGGNMANDMSWLDKFRTGTAMDGTTLQDRIALIQKNPGWSEAMNKGQSLYSLMYPGKQPTSDWKTLIRQIAGQPNADPVKLMQMVTSLPGQAGANMRRVLEDSGLDNYTGANLENAFKDPGATGEQSARRLGIADRFEPGFGLKTHEGYETVQTPGGQTQIRLKAGYKQAWDGTVTDPSGQVISMGIGRMNLPVNAQGQWTGAFNQPAAPAPAAPAAPAPAPQPTPAPPPAAAPPPPAAPAPVVAQPRVQPGTVPYGKQERPQPGTGMAPPFQPPMKPAPGTVDTRPQTPTSTADTRPLPGTVTKQPVPVPKPIAPPPPPISTQPVAPAPAAEIKPVPPTAASAKLLPNTAGQTAGSKVGLVNSAAGLK